MFNQSPIDIYPEDADFCTFAMSVHRTHQNKHLQIAGTFLEEIYKDQRSDKVIIKSTQCGLSEYAISKTLWTAFKGKSLIYILPTYDLKNLFVKDRVDRSLGYSRFYSSLLKEQPRKAADSASMKQIGEGIIIFSGSNTPNAFISFPASTFFIDEYDNCSQENIIMLPERQSATPPENRSSEKFGNPTIQNFGIDAEYKKTDKKEWHIKCPHCNKWIHPDFFKHVVMEIEKGIWIVRDPLYTGQEIINPICECGKPYNRFAMGEWIAEYPDRPISGYHVSKMFSTLNTLNELVARFNDGLTNESTMQRVYNGDLGLAYTAKGSKIDAEIIDGCIDSTYYMPDSCGQACIAGVDVGRMLNVCIGQPLSDGKIKMVYINTIRSENEIEIYEAFKKYNVRFFIIDAMPETRFSKKLIAIMNGRGFMNFYASDKRDLGTPNNENAVANSRTQALDAVKEFLLLNKIILPANARDIKDFYEQLGELTRVYDEKKDCYNWQGEGADHYCFSAGTLILTDTGEKPIEQIKRGDKVFTRKGFKKVILSEQTGNKETDKYKLNNTELQSTNDHPIWTKKGFIKISLLTRKHTCCILSTEDKIVCQIINRMKLFLKELLLEDIQNLKEDRTEFIIQQVRQIIKMELEDCIKKYGKTNTEKFQKVIQSIIKTTIRLIIQLKILNVLNKGNTKVCTLKKIVKITNKELSTILTGLDLYPQTGIEQKRAENGINNMLKILTLEILNIKEYVSNVIRSIFQKEKRGNFAVEHVNKNLDTILELITNKEYARIVKKSLQLINISRIDSVQNHVRKENVYNLFVENEHEYFANGVLVSNCHSMAYMVLAQRYLSIL